jgi:hypothetical protein
VKGGEGWGAMGGKQSRSEWGESLHSTASHAPMASFVHTNSILILRAYQY